MSEVYRGKITYKAFPKRAGKIKKPKKPTAPALTPALKEFIDRAIVPALVKAHLSKEPGK